MGIKIALPFAVFGSIAQLFTGHLSAIGIAQNQPAKLAAYEGHYEKSAPADLYLLGWVDEIAQKPIGIKIPGMLSWMIHGDFTTPVTGLQAFTKEDRPPVQFVFQTYHAMISIGMALIFLSLLGLFLLWKKRLFENRLILMGFVVSVLGPQLANQLGWFSAEVGRQPWIVYGLLRTSDALSKNVKAGAVMTSLILFTIVYLLLFSVFIYLLNYKISHGPDDEDLIPTGKLALPDKGVI